MSYVPMYLYLFFRNEPKEVLTELKNKLVHAFIDLDKLPGKEEIKKITNGKGNQKGSFMYFLCI